MTYDLTYFKFLGGIVVEEDDANTSSSSSTVQAPVEEIEYNLAPPRADDESPGNRIIFNSLWTTQHRDNKRSSLKAITGRVSDLKSRFEKSKRVISGVFSPPAGRGDVATAASDQTHQQRRKQKGPPPPQHVMTLAKGWNSGLEPSHQTKPVHVDY